MEHALERTAIVTFVAAAIGGIAWSPLWVIAAAALAVIAVANR